MKIEPVRYTFRHILEWISNTIEYTDLTGIDGIFSIILTGGVLMEPTIYLDVLILINIFVTYFLMLSAKLLLHIQTGGKRLLLAAVIGGFYSLIILADFISPIILNLLKLLVSMFLVFVAFGFCSWKLFVKNLMFFYLVNFVFAGFMFGIWYFVSPIGMVVKNGVVYFNVSAIVLAVSTIAAYLVVKLISYLFTKNVASNQMTDLIVECGGNEVMLRALVDTGNKLTDIITGYPVVICEFEAIKPLIPEDLHTVIQERTLDQMKNELWRRRVRVIPVKAVTGDSTVLAFKPDHFYIVSDTKRTEMQAIIGISSTRLSQGEFSALMNDSLLNE